MTFKILILLITVAFWSCEKNDPLAEQGELTGNVYPFNILSQMPDAAAGDTLTLRNVSWATDDDIETITFFHSGFKLQSFTVAISVQVEDEENTVYEFTESLQLDTVFTPHTSFAVYPEDGKTLNDYYQTLDNAYVILHEFIVPQDYALTKGSGEELVLNMHDDIFEYFLNHFSLLVNRDMMLMMFPDLNPFSVTYFKFDDQGEFTGELTEEGVAFYIDNTDRDLFNEFLKDATVNDNTRVTIETEAVLEGQEEGSVSERSFIVI